MISINGYSPEVRAEVHPVVVELNIRFLREAFPVRNLHKLVFGQPPRADVLDYLDRDSLADGEAGSPAEHIIRRQVLHQRMQEFLTTDQRTGHIEGLDHNSLEVEVLDLANYFS